MKKTFKKTDIGHVAEEVLSKISSGEKATVVALSGDLGAGKTTLTQQIAGLLGVKEAVISPTFVIMKIYGLSKQKWKHLVHIDAYRLESEKELELLGWHEMINDSSNLILIEWPEKVPGLTKDALFVSLSHKDEHTREILVR